ncbi:MAG: hypothetical protein KatS3mg109_1301 [Pirellulaceae bacterium]|nr:MAG: hypothetical protein KatS3mg109_1301 [Pirellulaceae bacterium]
MTALFIMAAVTAVVIAMVDTDMIQYAALHNTLDYERARYLAEAGIAHALAMLESDPSWRGTIPATEYPLGSGSVYEAEATDGTSGKVIVRATGKSGTTVRRLEAVVDFGG